MGAPSPRWLPTLWVPPGPSDRKGWVSQSFPWVFSPLFFPGGPGGAEPRERRRWAGFAFLALQEGLCSCCSWPRPPRGPRRGLQGSRLPEVSGGLRDGGRGWPGAQPTCRIPCMHLAFPPICVCPPSLRCPKARACSPPPQPFLHARTPTIALPQCTCMPPLCTAFPPIHTHPLCCTCMLPTAAVPPAAHTAPLHRTPSCCTPLLLLDVAASCSPRSCF